MSNVVMFCLDDPSPTAFDPVRMINLSPTAVSYWDRDLRCRFANAAFLDWFCIDPELMLGSELETVLDILRLDDHREHVEAALQGERRTAVKAFHTGRDRREGLVQYIPDARGHRIDGVLIQVSTIPSPPRLVRCQR